MARLVLKIVLILPKGGVAVTKPQVQVLSSRETTPEALPKPSFEERGASGEPLPDVTVITV